MKIMFAAFLLATAQTAAAAEPPCLTKAEFADASLFVLPALLEGAATKCQAFLPANAYLLTGGRELGSRLDAESDAHAQGALAAFGKFGGDKIPEGLSANTVGSLVRDMARTELFKKIGSEECAKIDEAAELLAPLPPANLVNLMRLLIMELMKKDKKPELRFCPAGTM